MSHCVVAEKSGHVTGTDVMSDTAAEEACWSTERAQPVSVLCQMTVNNYVVSAKPSEPVENGFSEASSKPPRRSDLSDDSNVV